MRLSVVIPATDGPVTLERCLAAIHAAAPPADEVIVVREADLPTPAAARNDGARAATGDVLVFVDADVLVHEDAFARVRETLAESALVAVFGSYDNRVATDGLVAGFRNLLHHVVHQRSAGTIPTFWAGLGAVRSDVFHSVGGFDPARRWLEDVELGGRIAAKGTILLDPELQGTHLKEWTLHSMVSTDVTGRGVPWVRLALERPELRRALNLGLRERLSAAASLVAAGALLGRRPRVTLTALACQVGLNTDLYGLLLRRLGPRGAVTGMALHVVHHLASAAALVVGLASHATGGDAGLPRRDRQE